MDMQIVLLDGASCELGPVALTEVLQKSDLIKKAQPSHSYYPYEPWPIRRILRPPSLFEERLHSDTSGVHLWAGQFRGLLKRRQEAGMQIVPRGSYLWQKCKEYDVEIKL